MNNLVKTKNFSGATTAKIYAFMTAAYCTLVTAMPALASEPGTAIQEGITKGTGALWNVLTAIAAPIAAVALAICAIQIFWGGQRAAENAKSVAVKIIIGIALVMLAPTLVSQVASWFQKASWFS